MRFALAESFLGTDLLMADIIGLELVSSWLMWVPVTRSLAPAPDVASAFWLSVAGKMF